MDFTITNGSIIIATIFWLSQKYKKTIRPEYIISIITKIFHLLYRHKILLMKFMLVEV